MKKAIKMIFLISVGVTLSFNECVEAQTYPNGNKAQSTVTVRFNEDYTPDSSEESSSSKESEQSTDTNNQVFPKFGAGFSYIAFGGLFILLLVSRFWQKSKKI